MILSRICLLIAVACALAACDNNANNDPPPSANNTPVAAPPALQFVPIALSEEVEGITQMKFIPGTDQFLVLRKDGEVRHFELNGDAATKLGAFTLPDVDDTSDCGLISMAFDPDYATNNFVYFGYCQGLGVNTISRHVLRADALDQVAATQREVITVRADDAEKAWHNVGSIEFDQEGALWAVFGENAIKEEAQDATTPLGAVLRIIPNREADGQGYTPAPNNPYADQNPDVYAVGLRSPWRASFDQFGRFWIGDVGAKAYEEVNVLTLGKHNFGWPVHEGPCKSDCEGFTDPVTSWDRTDDHPFVLDDDDTAPTSKRAGWIGAGHIPDGSNDPYDGALSDKMFYGDFCAGWVRLLGVSQDGAITSDGSVGNLTGVVSFSQAQDGHLYVTTYGNCATFPYKPGSLYRIELAP